MYNTTGALQIVRLKGRLNVTDLAVALDIAEAQAVSLVDELAAAGQVTVTGSRLKITPTGRENLDGLLAAERAGLDAAALNATYHDFDEFNDILKSLVTRWQLRSDGVPNDHTDPGYDEEVIDGLLELHGRFGPLLTRIVGLAPRLDHYPRRFANAIDRLRAGEHSWFARPLADSYHTLWFELHEDLIGVTGRTRAAEAAAGRAL